MTEHQWGVAVALWRDGRDTNYIAKYFGVHESYIYNFLPIQRRRMAA
jgi:transposase